MIILVRVFDPSQYGILTILLTIAYLLSNIGNKDIDEATVSRIKRIIQESGALGYCDRLTDKFVREAIQFIEKAHFRQEGKEFLIGIVPYIVKRSH